jgi:hypothetical protein
MCPVQSVTYLSGRSSSFHGGVGHEPRGGAHTGLVTPVRQMLALIGVRHFGTRRFPQEYLTVVTVIHYISAVAVAVLVPWWALAPASSRVPLGQLVGAISEQPVLSLFRSTKTVVNTIILRAGAVWGCSICTI